MSVLCIHPVELTPPREAPGQDLVDGSGPRIPNFNNDNNDNNNHDQARNGIGDGNSNENVNPYEDQEYEYVTEMQPTKNQTLDQDLPPVNQGLPHPYASLQQQHQRQRQQLSNSQPPHRMLSPVRGHATPHHQPGHGHGHSRPTPTPTDDRNTNTSNQNSAVRAIFSSNTDNSGSRGPPSRPRRTDSRITGSRRVDSRRTDCLGPVHERDERREVTMGGKEAEEMQSLGGKEEEEQEEIRPPRRTLVTGTAERGQGEILVTPVLVTPSSLSIPSVNRQEVIRIMENRIEVETRDGAAMRA